MSKPKTNHPFSDRELATVLAAIRYWQTSISWADGPDGVPADLLPHFEGIANGPLMLEEIDALCDRLNRDQS